MLYNFVLSQILLGFLVGSDEVKNILAMLRQVWSLSWEDSLEKGMDIQFMSGLLVALRWQNLPAMWKILNTVLGQGRSLEMRKLLLWSLFLQDQTRVLCSSSLKFLLFLYGSCSVLLWSWICIPPMISTHSLCWNTCKAELWMPSYPTPGCHQELAFSHLWQVPTFPRWGWEHYSAVFFLLQCFTYDSLIYFKSAFHGNEGQCV